MSSARHHTKTQPAEQTRAEIEADITNCRQAQRDLQAAGQHGVAERLRQDTDECLDELADLDAGTWRPKHA